jgi:hypothetical protein
MRLGSPFLCKTRLAPLIVLMTLVVTSCSTTVAPTVESPPGWYDDVRELFVGEAAFPDGWRAQLYQETGVDPRANHVHRRFSNPPIAGIVSQDIWRAYTTVEAERKYDKLRASQFKPSRSLYPGTTFVPFEPPAEISFQSQVADEVYLACGWIGWAFCQVIARYRNYVVYMRLDREAQFEGNHSSGLTYAEIEAVVGAMDAKFAAVIEASYPSPW